MTWIRFNWHMLRFFVVTLRIQLKYLNLSMCNSVFVGLRACFYFWSVEVVQFNRLQIHYISYFNLGSRNIAFAVEIASLGTPRITAGTKVQGVFL